MPFLKKYRHYSGGYLRTNSGGYSGGCSGRKTLAYIKKKANI